MKGFRAGLREGFNAERPRRPKPLTAKERQKLKRLLAKQKAAEALY